MIKESKSKIEFEFVEEPTIRFFDGKEYRECKVVDMPYEIKTLYNRWIGNLSSYETMTGKGVDVRKYDRKKFNENFDKIFGKRSTRPKTHKFYQLDINENNQHLKNKLKEKKHDR